MDNNYFNVYLKNINMLKWLENLTIDKQFGLPPTLSCTGKTSQRNITATTFCSSKYVVRLAQIQGLIRLCFLMEEVTQTIWLLAYPTNSLSAPLPTLADACSVSQLNHWPFLPSSFWPHPVSGLRYHIVSWMTMFVFCFFFFILFGDNFRGK